MATRSFLTFDQEEGEPLSSSVVASGLRFHLAEDRIRAFLMGENLYGEPELAVRELYQNALDACRLATARREFLRLPGAPSSREAPEIEFFQGVDDTGRPFIDCLDHGAGMGIAEMSQAFCQAGVRASDLADRAAETAAFAAASPPVELWQNSRFGIGVLSYFMLADAVSVTTARLERDGSIGSLLSMHIPGPAEAFDVVDHGASTDYGTRVRLWLKPNVSVSAVATLRDLVITCPVNLRAADQRGLEHRWSPGELNQATSKLSLSPHNCVPAIPGTLWWVHADGLGAVLADGLWAGAWLPGMVMNLHGAHSPALTADRQKIVGLDFQAIESQCEAAASTAVADAWHIVGNPDWLLGATGRFPRLADAIIARAFDRDDRAITMHKRQVDVAMAGFVPGDEEHSTNSNTTPVVNWRLSRLAAGGLYTELGVSAPAHRSVAPGRPSDAIMLGMPIRIERSGTNDRPSRWFESAVSIYDAERLLRYPLRQIIARARELGLPVAENADALPDTNTVVRTALSFARRQTADGTFRPLSAFDLQQTSWRLGIPVSDVIGELEMRTIEFDELARTLVMRPLPTADLIAVSEDATGIAPWLRPSDAVGMGHVSRAARASGKLCSEIIETLRSLGFVDVPVLDLTGAEPTDHDVRLLSRDLDGEAPTLRADQVSPMAHLHDVSRELGEPVSDLRRRLGRFGITFSDDVPVPSEHGESKRTLLRRLGLPKEKRRLVRWRHLRMISQDGDGQAPWLDPSTPVPAWLVATVALHMGSIDEVIAGYRWLGYDVNDPRTASVTAIPGAAAAHP
ncbi:hypothetical protein N1027_11205 [Herbiconiux sp. CPCC 205763]|uniref:wHTH-Hsp90 Na associated domain-containing protein n=1 Tax=Herbiconiux aconitum TaxID=2970913 RepID=A0ABT2GUU1_9MICO|nr:hypothetical protein [Herbiconiux aconitum]MCS5718699.1 hypothetical protein [Herbiconiux aconitum]